jgi:hypothetical protein
MLPIRLYCGMDPREQAGLHVFLESVWKHTTQPISLTVLTPKIGDDLGIGTDGTNRFSTLRFAVPHLNGYSGWAIFMDGADQLLRADLAELWRQCDGKEAVKVVKHTYRTQHPKKYLGTTLEADNADYERKNWSSVILWNCGHWAHFRNRDKLLGGDGRYLHRFSWLLDEEIGEIPATWNHIPGEMEPNPKAKLVHFSLGVPIFNHYRHVEHSAEYRETLHEAASGIQSLGLDERATTST